MGAGADVSADQDGKPNTRSTAAEAAALIMTEGAKDFGQHLGTFLDSDDPDGAHKSRVALRRLRAALIAFEPIIAPKLVEKLKTRLKSAFHELGRVRDADVLADHTQDCGKLEKLRDQAARMRRKVRKHLLHDNTDHLAHKISGAFAGKDWRARSAKAKALRRAPVGGLAAQALDYQWFRLLARGPDLAALSDPERHGLRKRLKTFRYLAEYFVPLWPDAATEAFLSELGALQDDLGALNDVSMARTQGIAVKDTDEVATLERARSTWARLSREIRWWAPGS